MKEEFNEEFCIAWKETTNKIYFFLVKYWQSCSGKLEYSENRHKDVTRKTIKQSL